MADFSKASGNSKQGVELIAVVKPGRMTKDGKKFVDFMVNNSAIKKADAEKGIGQSNPNLYTDPTKKTTYTDSKGVEKTKLSNGIPITMSQLAAIEAVGKGKMLEKELPAKEPAVQNAAEQPDKKRSDDNTIKYIPFKADLIDYCKGDKKVGYIPNTKTLQPTELGNLTEKRLAKHYANTSVINAAQKEQAQTVQAAPKSSRFASAASIAPTETPEKGAEASFE